MNTPPIESGIPWSSDLNTLALRYGDRVAVDNGREQLTYRELSQRAHALAKMLLNNGVKPGDFVGIYLPNGIEAVWADYGVTITGACLVHLNAAYTAQEIAWAGHLAPMCCVVTDGPCAQRLSELPDVERILVEDVPVSTDVSTFPPVPVHAWGRIIYSSGTTGKPKALVYDQRSRWIAMIMLRAVLPFVPRPGSRILLMTPYVHGSSMQARAWLDYGATVVLLKGVQIDVIREQVGTGAVDAIFAPPTVLAKLVAEFEGQRLSSVKCVFTGTQTLTKSLYEKAHTIFGPAVRVTYGKSENVNPITVLDAADTHACFYEGEAQEGACLGWPAPGVELRIDANDEISLRSQHMYTGHIDAEGFHPRDADGWHRTGDLGRIDDRGRLWLLGRMSDVIKSGGYKVYPDEIEAVLAGTPGCGDICVVALPSDHWGEVIVAVAEQSTTGPAWIESAQSKVVELARYKHPRAYVTLDKLPRNPQGKISRRVVRDLVLLHYVMLDGAYPKVIPVTSV